MVQSRAGTLVDGEKQLLCNADARAIQCPAYRRLQYLQVFESGDAADADTWNMAVGFVKRAGNGWKVARDGVFVRELKDLETGPEGGNEAGDSSSLLVN